MGPDYRLVMAVLPEHQRRGLGDAVLSALLEQVRVNLLADPLVVDCTNGTACLVERLEQATGLELIGRENEFYGDYYSAEEPLDAALVVRKDVPPYEDEPVYPELAPHHTIVVLAPNDLTPEGVERCGGCPDCATWGSEV